MRLAHYIATSFSTLFLYIFCLRSAAAETWPSSAVLGCFVHYSQCLWRNFSHFDLVPEYKELTSEIRKSFQRIKPLPFVPEDDISSAWEVLKPTIPCEMANLTQYYESTWIGTPDSPAKIDPACWNHPDPAFAGLPRRSSNIAEGWYLGFKSLVQCTNPTLWTFFDALRLEQGLTDQRIAERLMLRAPEPRPKKWIEVDQKLEEKSEDNSLR